MWLCSVIIIIVIIIIIIIITNEKIKVMLSRKRAAKALYKIITKGSN